MSNTKPYKSIAIDSILAKVDPKIEKQIEFQMKLAAKIDDARIKKGLSKKQFAQKLSKRPSEISKWLSGTHNFTVNTLFDIQKLLDVDLINVEDNPREQILQFSTQVIQEGLYYPISYGYSNPEDLVDLLYKSYALNIPMSGLMNIKTTAEA